jgi:predicted HAD superfamily phosphohydrolase
VTLVLVSPLLAIAGFYDPPFRVRAEESVKLVIQDSEEILQGRIDALVICDSFWVMIWESKKTMLSMLKILKQFGAGYVRVDPE